MEAGRRPEGRRLGRADWIRAGHDLLVRSGPASLTLARIAQSLGVTTGSFYWHFGSRAEFLSALAEEWVRSLLEPTAREARAADGDGRQQLQVLGRLLRSRRLPELDAAMRTWARTDAGAAEAVRRADALRVSYLTAFLRSTGLTAQDAQLRAELVMRCWAGMHAVEDGTSLRSRARKLGALIELLSGSPGAQGRRSRGVAAPGIHTA
jgi:AcrR family transcriptional regulator